MPHEMKTLNVSMMTQIGAVAAEFVDHYRPQIRGEDVPAPTQFMGDAVQSLTAAFPEHCRADILFFLMASVHGAILTSQEKYGYTDEGASYLRGVGDAALEHLRVQPQ